MHYLKKLCCCVPRESRPILGGGTYGSITETHTFEISRDIHGCGRKGSMIRQNIVNTAASITGGVGLVMGGLFSREVVSLATEAFPNLNGGCKLFLQCFSMLVMALPLALIGFIAGQFIKWVVELIMCCRRCCFD